VEIKSTFTATITYEEMLAIVAVSGHIGGDGQVRELFTTMAKAIRSEVPELRGRDAPSTAAADLLDTGEGTGSLYYDKKEIGEDDPC
jgi:hypothetical protein